MRHDDLVPAHDRGDCSALGQIDFLDFPADAAAGVAIPVHTPASSASATPRCRRAKHIAMFTRAVRPSARLAHVRAAMSPRLHSLRRGVAEALEAVVHGNRDSCRASAGKSRKSICPKGAAIAAIVRGDKVIMRITTRWCRRGPRHRFVTAKKDPAKVEKLFEVSVDFV